MVTLSSPLKIKKCFLVFLPFHTLFLVLLQRRPVLLTLDSKLLAPGNVYKPGVAWMVPALPNSPSSDLFTTAPLALG